MKKLFILLLLLIVPLMGFSQQEETYNPKDHDEEYISGELYPFLHSYEVTTRTYSYNKEKGETEVTVETFTEYHIKISNDQAMIKDREMFYMGYTNQIMMIHPIPKVEKNFFQRAYKRWHFFYTKVFGPYLIAREQGPVLEYSRWKRIPQILKHILNVFGFDNDELLYIGYNVETGTIDICFHPDYFRDREFYLQRLSELMEYFSTTDFYQVVPIPDPIQKNL